MKGLLKRAYIVLACIIMTSCSDYNNASIAYPSNTGSPQKNDMFGNILGNEFYFWRNNLSADEQAAYDLIYRHTLTFNPIILLSKSVKAERVQNILDAVRFDNPELFWLENTLRYYHNGDEATGLELNYTFDSSQLSERQAAFDEHTEEVYTKAALLSTDAERVKYIRDYLSYSVEYDEAAIEDQSVFGAVVTGRTVCMGYSLAFTYYMQKLGILSCLVTGMAEGEAHTWNLVQIDGEYLNIDITWDDPTGNPADCYYYNYYNKTDAEIEYNHIRSAECMNFPKSI